MVKCLIKSSTKFFILFGFLSMVNLPYLRNNVFNFIRLSARSDNAISKNIISRIELPPLTRPGGHTLKWGILGTLQAYTYLLSICIEVLGQRPQLLTRVRPEPSIFYRVANPFFRMTWAALTSRSRCFPQCGQSHSRIFNQSNLLSPNRWLVFPQLMQVWLV